DVGSVSWAINLNAHLRQSKIRNRRCRTPFHAVFPCVGVQRVENSWRHRGPPTSPSEELFCEATSLREPALVLRRTIPSLARGSCPTPAFSLRCPSSEQPCL